MINYNGGCNMKNGIYEEYDIKYTKKIINQGK